MLPAPRTRPRGPPADLPPPPSSPPRSEQGVGGGEKATKLDQILLNGNNVAVVSSPPAPVPPHPRAPPRRAASAVADPLGCEPDLAGSWFRAAGRRDRRAPLAMPRRFPGPLDSRQPPGGEGRTSRWTASRGVGRAGGWMGPRRGGTGRAGGAGRTGAQRRLFLAAAGFLLLASCCLYTWRGARSNIILSWHQNGLVFVRCRIFGVGSRMATPMLGASRSTRFRPNARNASPWMKRKRLKSQRWRTAMP